VETLQILKKFLIGLSLLLTQASWAADTYDPSSNQLSIPRVELLSTTYFDVVVKVGDVLRIDGGTPSRSIDLYDPVTNQLTIPSVVANGVTFTNVLVSVGQVIGVGASITIQGLNLIYGATATFNVVMSNPNYAVTGIADKCSNLTQTISPTKEAIAYNCKIKGAGTLTFTAKDGQGAVLVKQLFTVPAPQIQMATSLGNVMFELNPNYAPLSVDNFMKYVDAGFYTNTIFHRIIPNFVVQAGGFKSGLTPMTPTFDTIGLESNNGLSNLTGTLAMARTSDPNSANSQFYVNLLDNPFLNYVSGNNPGYAVFGKVIAGLDVIKAIGLVPTGTVKGLADVPITEVTITSMVRVK